ncbi:MAG: hypothetical protein IT305_12920 [Chloroflexi bacterium]|nr:hypothetical protein [Chloroflexota bacterium]
MTEHLTSNELRRYQFDGRVYHLDSLARQCGRRFLRAANLVDMRSKSIDSLRHTIAIESIDLMPLVPAWYVICDRYLAEQYNPQLALLPDLVEDEPERWNRFVHHHLLPELVRDDELVRNVLRALGALPCKSPSDAASAVRSHFLNMTLPHDKPLWAPEEDIDL